MAEESDGLVRDASNKTPKDIKFKHYVCILCDRPYNRYEIEQENEAKVLSYTLCVCHKCNTDEITSKDFSFNAEDRTIIAKVKAITYNDVKQKIIKEAKEKVKETVDDPHNVTFYEADSEITALKIENYLLKELNQVLNDKNELLSEKIETVKKSTSVIKVNSYAEITKIKTKPKRVPKLIVSKTNSKDSNDKIKKKITQTLLEDKNIKANKIVINDKNELIINCSNNESVDKTMSLITNKLSNICEIEKEEIANPTMRIVGIEQINKLNIKDLEEDINVRNFNEYDNKCRIVHSYTNSKNNTLSVIINVPSDLYKLIRENKNKIYVGHQCCRAFDILSVKPCFKCCRFYHKKDKCDEKNKVTCLRCAGEHNTVDCTNINNKKCSNCLYSNKKFGSNYNTNHWATDSQDCEIFKNKIKKWIETIDYSVMPVFQRFHGKADFSHTNSIDSHDSRNHGKTTETITRNSQQVNTEPELPTNDQGNEAGDSSSEDEEEEENEKIQPRKPKKKKKDKNVNNENDEEKNKGKAKTGKGKTGGKSTRGAKTSEEKNGGS